MCLFIIIHLLQVVLVTIWTVYLICGERYVWVCLYVRVCVCVSIMPSLGFFISNQRAIDSPDFAPARLFHWCVESDGPFRQKWNQIKNVKIMLSL